MKKLFIILIFLLIPSTISIPPPDFQLTAAIEQIRKEKLQSFESGSFIICPRQHWR